MSKSHVHLYGNMEIKTTFSYNHPACLLMYLALTMVNSKAGSKIGRNVIIIDEHIVNRSVDPM